MVVVDNARSSEIGFKPSPRTTRNATSASALVKPKSRLINIFGGSASCSGSMIITRALAAERSSAIGSGST
jgi:hypothetical protein